jgi:hypothetical protein
VHHQLFSLSLSALQRAQRSALVACAQTLLVRSEQLRYYSQIGTMRLHFIFTPVRCIFSAHLAHGKSAIKFHHWTLTLPAAERTLFIRATISVGCDKERSAQGLVPSLLAFQYSSALFASILHLQYTPTAEIALPFALR